MVGELPTEQVLRGVEDGNHAAQRLDASEVASEVGLAFLNARVALLVLVAT